MEYSAEGEHVAVKFYLMESLHEAAGGEGRAVGWHPLEEAIKLLTHDESKYVLRAAERRRGASHDAEAARVLDEKQANCASS